MSDPQPAPGTIVCIRCRKGGLDPQEVFLSGDGWLCEPCYKNWNAQEELKQPKPLFYNPKSPVNLDELPTYTDEELARSNRWALLRGLAIALAMLGFGLAGTWALYAALTQGIRTRRGLGVLGAAPLLAITGAILTVWNLRDLWKSFRGAQDPGSSAVAPPSAKLKTASQWLFSMPVIVSLMVLAFGLAMAGFGGIDLWVYYKLGKAPEPISIDELERDMPVAPLRILSLGEHVPFPDEMSYLAEGEGPAEIRRVHQVYYPVFPAARMLATRNTLVSQQGGDPSKVSPKDYSAALEVRVLVLTNRFRVEKDITNAFDDKEFPHKDLIGRVIGDGNLVSEGTEKSFKEHLPNFHRQRVLVFEEGRGSRPEPDEAGAYFGVGLLGILLALVLPRALRGRQPVVDSEQPAAP